MKRSANYNLRRWTGLLVLLTGTVVLLALSACGSETASGPTPAEQRPVSSPDSAPVRRATATATETQIPPVTSGEPAPTGNTAASQNADTTDREGKSTPAATRFPVPPDRDFFRLVKELVPGTGDIDRVVSRDAPMLERGHRKTFQLVDLRANLLYESEFELCLVTPHAYWFVEDGIEVGLNELERSAREFEEVIYPQVTGVFGHEWIPGVDGDPHLYIINANMRGVGGYYSAADEYPQEIRPVSNEIEAIYINIRHVPPGTERYTEVLAHELQHAIHWNADLSEETWVNEGLSELAVTLAGYPERSIMAFRRAGPTSLTQWPVDDVGGAENYGAASMFMRYLTEHYGSRIDLRPLLAEPADGIPGIDAYLQATGHDVSFTDVFRDWAVANLLDEDGSRYGYSDLSIPFPVYANLVSDDDLWNTIPQYANAYVSLEGGASPSRLVFEGEPTVPLLPVDTGAGCWWSNKGDVIDSTITAAIDLGEADSPVLEYEVWYSIEEDWDFAYVEVSEDGGSTWTIIETPLSNTADPLNVSFGPGYTGATDGWLHESLSLDRWSGQEIKVRFQYITDAAIHDHGLCLRNLAVSMSGDETLNEVEWVPDGFAWTNNVVRQDFIVQVVYDVGEAGHSRVQQVELDSETRGNILLEPDPNSKRIVAVIQPIAASTRIPATYTLRLEAVE